MNKDQIKGKFEQIKGEVKERIGKATGDVKTQVEGFVGKHKGKAQEKLGDTEEGMKQKAPVEEGAKRESERTEPEEP